MATNIDKGLYQAPAGLESEATDVEPIEIEIEDPESVAIRAGGMEIEIEKAQPSADDFDANLVDFMDDQDLAQLAGDLANEVDNDRSSRKDWEETYKEGLKLLGLKYEERTEPWDGASGVFHPMITEAVVKFQSEAITETFPAKGPVMTKIIGKETRERQEAAQRVAEDMNYQLTEQMVEFRPEHERMLWNLACSGSAFKKVYYDPNLGRQTSVFVPAEDVILPYGTTDIFTCYRITHVMRKTKNDIIKLQQAGFYTDVELGDPGSPVDDIQKAKDEETGFSANFDDRFELYEIQADLDLPGFEDKDKDGEPTGIALPYVVTISTSTNTILAIRRNWDPTDKLQRKLQHFVHYQYIPGFGAYGFGLFHLIGGFAKSATSLMRQLVDAGTLSNLPGGLKSRGLRIKGDDTPIAPGEFRDVDLGSGSIKDNIMMLPYKEPSTTLYQLLGNIVEEGRKFAATADMKISDMSAQAPVGTTLALLERQLKTMSAIQARMHHSFKQELKMLAAIIRDYADDLYSYEPDTANPRARKSDFSQIEIVPVSDPNAATMSQRVVQYQAVIQLAQMSPEIYNLPMLHRQMLDVLGIKDADKLVPLEDDFKPRDPVAENMDIINGKPVKAFFYQDHDAHIQVHQAAMQDPMLMQMMGQNPKAQMMMAAAQAHIAEHIGFKYRQMIEQRMGVTLPPVDEEMTPEVESALSEMMATAAQQILEQNQAQAAQMQAQQRAQDPVVQMQQMELQLKQQKQQADVELERMRLQLEQQKIESDAAAKADRLALDEQIAMLNAQVRGVQMANEKNRDSTKAQIEGFKLGSGSARGKG